MSTQTILVSLFLVAACSGPSNPTQPTVPVAADATVAPATPAAQTGPAAPTPPPAQPDDVHAYYLALPENMFFCEIEPPQIDRAFKEGAITRENLKNGYLLAVSEGMSMQVALFKDRKRKLDLIAVNLPCGMGCMCERFDLLVYSNGTWSPWAGSFPAEEDIRRAAGIGEDDGYELVLPEVGTNILVLDPDSRKELATIAFREGEFALQ